jgi:hypothetical protein
MPSDSDRDSSVEEVIVCMSDSEMSSDVDHPTPKAPSKRPEKEQKKREAKFQFLVEPLPDSATKSVTTAIRLPNKDLLLSVSRKHPDAFQLGKIFFDRVLRGA